MIVWGHRKAHRRGAHPRTRPGTRLGGTQVDTPQGHALGVHKGTHPRDTLRMWACCITLILQYTKMAWIEKREGSNNYMACWKQNGKKIRKSTGVPISGKAGMPPRQARKLALELANNMECAAKGETGNTLSTDDLCTVAQPHGMRARIPSVQEYLSAFHGYASPRTESNRRRAFNVFLEWLGSRAEMRLDMLTKGDMIAFFQHALKQVSIGTVSDYRYKLASAFNRAVDDEFLVRSPVPANLNITKLAQEGNIEIGRDKVKLLPFTPAELRHIVTQFPAPWCDMSLVSVMTGGQGMGDICMLRWKCINFAEDYLVFSTGKTGMDMKIPMHALLRERLLVIRAAQGEQEEYVFPHMARRYGRKDTSISTEFTTMLKTSGIVHLDIERTALQGKRKNVSPKSFLSFRLLFVEVERACNRSTSGVDASHCGESKMSVYDVIAQAITAPADTPLPAYPILPA